MTSSYTADVRRFGGPKPFQDINGQPRNLGHQQDFSADKVVTDGHGNVISMPLLRKKPCFGRPERFYRGMAGLGVWVNSDGETSVGHTQCDTCSERSPGVFKSCRKVVDERVSSNVSVAIAIGKWIDTCHAKQVIGRKHFYGPLWPAVLDAIIASGGWTNVNDDQVKLDNLSRAEEKRKNRNETAKRVRAAKKAAKNSSPPIITNHYMQSLEDECDRRAAQLRSLRGLSTSSTSGTLWIDALSDEVCDRVAHVWAERELLLKQGRTPKNAEIARSLIRMRPAYGNWEEKSLAARVGEDIAKRLDRLEDSSGGEPIWDIWIYKVP